MILLSSKNMHRVSYCEFRLQNPFFKSSPTGETGDWGMLCVRVCVLEGGGYIVFIAVCQ